MGSEMCIRDRTKGGPGISTNVLGLYIYQEGFSYFNTSYASAVSLIVMVFVSGLILLGIKISRKENVGI